LRAFAITCDAATTARLAARAIATVAALFFAVLFVAGHAAAAGSPVPKSCPPASKLAKVLHAKVRAVSQQAGQMSTAATQGPGAPSGDYTPATSSGYQRTCTYAAPAPLTISFSAPVSAKSFAVSREAQKKNGGAVVVPGLGDSAWAAKSGGEIFILDGTLDIVISAPASTGSQLRALAHELV
jgi:hypothetical protein